MKVFYLFLSSLLFLCLTGWKVSKCRVISGPHFPVFVPKYRDLWSKSPYSVKIQENTDQKKLRIWTLFTQCLFLVFVFLPHVQILVILWFKKPVLILAHLSLVLSQIQLHNTLFVPQNSQALIFLLLLNLVSTSPTNRNNISFSIPSFIKSNDSKTACAPSQTFHLLLLPIKSSKCLFQSSTQVC